MPRGGIRVETFESEENFFLVVEMEMMEDGYFLFGSRDREEEITLHHSLQLLFEGALIVVDKETDVLTDVVDVVIVALD